MGFFLYFAAHSGSHTGLIAYCTSNSDPFSFDAISVCVQDVTDLMWFFIFTLSLVNEHISSGLSSMFFNDNPLME